MGLGVGTWLDVTEGEGVMVLEREVLREREAEGVASCVAVGVPVTDAVRRRLREAVPDALQLRVHVSDWDVLGVKERVTVVVRTGVRVGVGVRVRGERLVLVVGELDVLRVWEGVCVGAREAELVRLPEALPVVEREQEAVGAKVGVGVGDGETERDDAEGDPEGDRVRVREAVVVRLPEGEAEGVALWERERERLELPAREREGDGDRLKVWETRAVAEHVDEGEADGVAEGVLRVWRVRVRVEVGVGLPVCGRDEVAEGDRERVRVGVRVGTALGDRDTVAEGERDPAVRDGDPEREEVRDCEEAEAVRVGALQLGVGVAGEGVEVKEEPVAVVDGDAERMRDPVAEAVGLRLRRNDGVAEAEAVARVLGEGVGVRVGGVRERECDGAAVGLAVGVADALRVAVVGEREAVRLGLCDVDCAGDGEGVQVCEVVQEAVVKETEGLREREAVGEAERVRGPVVVDVAVRDEAEAVGVARLEKVREREAVGVGEGDSLRLVVTEGEGDAQGVAVVECVWLPVPVTVRVGTCEREAVPDLLWLGLAVDAVWVPDALWDGEGCEALWLKESEKEAERLRAGLQDAEVDVDGVEEWEAKWEAVEVAVTVCVGCCVGLKVGEGLQEVEGEEIVRVAVHEGVALPEGEGMLEELGVRDRVRERDTLSDRAEDRERVAVWGAVVERVGVSEQESVQEHEALGRRLREALVVGLRAEERDGDREGLRVVVRVQESGPLGDSVELRDDEREAVSEGLGLRDCAALRVAVRDDAVTVAVAVGTWETVAVRVALRRRDAEAVREGPDGVRVR